jgi:hypothetical protein
LGDEKKGSGDDGARVGAALKLIPRSRDQVVR